MTAQFYSRFIIMTWNNFTTQILVNDLGDVSWIVKDRVCLNHGLYVYGVNDDAGTGVCWWEGDWWAEMIVISEPDVKMRHLAHVLGLGQTHPAESTGVAPHPPISTAAPKHAGYLGSLRTDLLLKRCMQSQGSREKAGSWKLKHNKHIHLTN